MKNLFLFFFLLLVFSCNTNHDIGRNGIILNITKPNDELIKILDLTGNKYLANIELEVNIKKRNYIYFMAIAPKRLEPGNSKLENFKKIGGCRLNYSSMDKDSFYRQKIDFYLVSDYRIPLALNNDSTYFSLARYNLNTVPGIEDNEHLFYDIDFKKETYYGAEIINLVKGTISKNNNTSPKIFSLGIAFYDCKKDDLKKIFSSNAFLEMVWSQHNYVSIAECTN